MSAREANRKSQKLFPLVKMTEKHGRTPMHLKLPFLYGTASLYIVFKNVITLNIGAEVFKQIL